MGPCYAQVKNPLPKKPLKENFPPFYLVLR